MSPELSPRDGETPRAVEQVVAEIKQRAEDGCISEAGYVCSDRDYGLPPSDWCDRCLMGRLSALLTAAGQEVKMKDLESRMDSTSSSQQHIDAGENQPVPATVSDHQVSNEDDGRCQCGALLGTNMACWTCVSRIG